MSKKIFSILLILTIAANTAQLFGAGDTSCNTFNMGHNNRNYCVVEKGQYQGKWVKNSGKKMPIVVNRLEDFFYIE
jgi:hypothetical protein